MGSFNRCNYFLVPKLQPTVSNYIESEFINNLGLGIAIFIFTLFLTIVFGKSFRKSCNLDWSWAQ